MDIDVTTLTLAEVLQLLDDIPVLVAIFMAVSKWFAGVRDEKNTFGKVGDLIRKIHPSWMPVVVFLTSSILPTIAFIVVLLVPAEAIARLDSVWQFIAVLSVAFLLQQRSYNKNKKGVVYTKEVYDMKK